MKKLAPYILLLSFCLINSCNRSKPEEISPNTATGYFPYKPFLITNKETDLGFALLDTIGREMAFLHGDKNENGVLETVKRLVYQLPEKNVLFNITIKDNFLIEDALALTEGAAIRFSFSGYDLVTQKVNLTIRDEFTNQVLLSQQSIVLDKNMIDNIKKAQGLGRQVASGGRQSVDIPCDRYIDLTRVLISVLACVTSYAPTFNLIGLALAGGPATIIMAAITAGVGTLLSCKSASDDLNNLSAGKCKMNNNIPQSVYECLLASVSGIFSRDIKQIGSCYASAADVLFEKGSQQPSITQPANGFSTGDPHLITTDQFPYDFQGHGEFIALKSTEDNFEVQVRQEDVRNTGMATLNTAVAVQTGVDIVCVTTMPDNIYVNGVPRGLAFDKLSLKNNAFIHRSSDSGLTVFDISTQNGDVVQVRFHNSYLLDYILYLKDNRKNKVVGLLGNFDGNPRNDLQFRNGEVIKNDFGQLYPRFADSWRVMSAQSLFYYTAGKTTESYTRRDFPLSKPILSVEAMQRAEALCRKAGISTEPHLNNCILDVALLNDNALINSALLADRIDPRPESPSITKFIEDSSYAATYQVVGGNLVLEITGRAFFYSRIYVDINQNQAVDGNLDRAYATGVKFENDQDVSFCPVYILDDNSLSSPCGTAPSQGSLAVNNFTQKYTIPLQELDPTNVRKEVYMLLFLGDKAYPKITGRNIFTKPLMLTIRP